MLATGRFLSMFLASILRFLDKGREIKALPVELPIADVQMGIFTLKNRTVSPVANLFIEQAREEARQRVELMQLALRANARGESFALMAPMTYPTEVSPGSSAPACASPSRWLVANARDTASASVRRSVGCAAAEPVTAPRNNTARMDARVMRPASL
jgi:hypothetical protein